MLKGSASPFRPSFFVLALVLGIVGSTFMPAAPQGEAAGETKAALPGLVADARWEKAAMVVDKLIAASPDDPELLRWKNDLELVAKYKAYHFHFFSACEGEFWIRRGWVGFDMKKAENTADQSKANENHTFWSPIKDVALKMGVQENSGVMGGVYRQFVLEMKLASNGKKYKLMLEGETDQIGMEGVLNRLNVLKARAGMPFTAPPKVDFTTMGVAEIRNFYRDKINRGELDSAQKAVDFLFEKEPEDTELLGLREKLTVVAQWEVGTKYSRGKLCLRKNWLSYSSDGEFRDNKFSEDSFTIPVKEVKGLEVYSRKTKDRESGGIIGAAIGLGAARFRGVSMLVVRPGGSPTPVKYDFFMLGSEDLPKDFAEQMVKTIQDQAVKAN